MKFLFIVCFLFVFFKPNNKYHFKFFINNKQIKNGYVHFLTAGEINEIQFYQLDLSEKQSQSCHIKKGEFVIDKTYLNKVYNKINNDTIEGFFRCINRDKLSLGYSFKFNKNQDSIKVYFNGSAHSNCFNN